MANAQLFDLLHELRLPGMREEIEHQFENPQYDTMPFSNRAMRMAQAEVERRYRNKINRLMKNAQFKVSAEPEEIDYRGERNLDKSEILDLLKCDWIKRKRNILITGASGTGKTWLACALGVSAVRHELSVRYALALEDGLRLFLVDGQLEISNNSVENIIRHVAIVRKNALFAGSEAGGEYWAIAQSIIATCKLNNLDPEEYLKWIFGQMEAKLPRSQYHKLLPWNCPLRRNKPKK